MGYYGKGKSYNDIKELKTKRLSEYFIEHLTKSSCSEIWVLYNKMFDECIEVTRDLQQAILASNKQCYGLQYKLEVEVLRYCSHTYTSQEFNNLLSLIEESCYKKCNQIMTKNIRTKAELQFIETIYSGLGFRDRLRLVGQLNISIPIKSVYNDIRKREQLRIKRVNIQRYKDDYT